jgi:hypothetical protein
MSMVLNRSPERSYAMRRLVALASLAIWGIACQTASADTFRNYRIQIDQENANVVYNPFGAVDHDFTTGRWWGSVGDSQGRNFPNQTQSLTIYGMWLKLKFPKKEGVDGDTFTANSTGGKAFPDVWRKKDGSELIFRGPGVAPGDYFWMKAPKTDDTDVRDRFFAQLYSEAGKPDVPNDGTWEKIAAPAVADKRAGTRRSTEPPLEIRGKVFLFAQAVEDGSAHAPEIKTAVGRGADYYGKPYFLGGSDLGGAGFFTFWLFNPTDKTYRAYSLDVTQPTGRALMKTVLFAFAQKAQWVAVYSQSQSPDKPVYVTVYP